MQLLNKFLFWISLICLINLVQAVIITQQNEHEYIKAGARLGPSDSIESGVIINQGDTPRDLTGLVLNGVTIGDGITFNHIYTTRPPDTETGGIRLNNITATNLAIIGGGQTDTPTNRLDTIRIESGNINGFRVENFHTVRNVYVTNGATVTDAQINTIAILANVLVDGLRAIIQFHGTIAVQTMQDANFNNANLTGTTLQANLIERPTFFEVNLTDAAIRAATLNEPQFNYVNLTHTDLRDIPIAALNFPRILRQLFVNNTATGFNVGMQLPNGINLGRIDFNPQTEHPQVAGVVMPGAIMPANINGWDFRVADLTGADFTRVRSGNGAVFAGALLLDVDLTQLTLAAIRGMNFADAVLTNTQFPPFLDHLVLDRVHGIFQIPAHFPYPRPASVQVSSTSMGMAYFDVNDPTRIILSSAPGTQFRVNPTNSTASGSSSLSFSDTDGTGGSYSANNRQLLLSDGSNAPLILFLRSRPGNKFHGVKLNTTRTPGIEDATFD